MQIFIVIILAVVLVVWGVATGMGNYASAAQAQAAIEASRAAQAASFGTIVLTGLVTVLIIVVIALLAYIVVGPKLRRLARRGQRPGFGGFSPYGQPRMGGVDPQTMIAMLQMYQMLQAQQRRALPRAQAPERYQYPQLPAEVENDEIWP